MQGRDPSSHTHFFFPILLATLTLFLPQILTQKKERKIGFRIYIFINPFKGKKKKIFPNANKNIIIIGGRGRSLNKRRKKINFFGACTLLKKTYRNKCVMARGHFDRVIFSPPFYKFFNTF